MSATIAPRWRPGPMRIPGTPAAAELRRLRQERGLSMGQLGRAMGEDHAQISRFESGDRTPSRATLGALTRVLALTDAEVVRLARLLWTEADD